MEMIPCASQGLFNPLTMVFVFHDGYFKGKHRVATLVRASDPIRLPRRTIIQQRPIGFGRLTAEGTRNKVFHESRSAIALKDSAMLRNHSTTFGCCLICS